MSTYEAEPPDPDDMFKDTRMSFGDHIEDLRTHLLRAVKGFALCMIIAIWPIGPYVLRIIVDPVETQLNYFEDRKVEKDIAEERLKRGNTVTMSRARPYLINKDQFLVEMGLKPAAPPEPPFLESVPKAFEKLIENLDAAHLLDEDVRRQTGFVKIELRAVDSFAETAETMREQARIRRKRLATMNITEAFMVYLKVSGLTGLVISSPWVFYQIWMFVAAGLYPHEKRLVNVYLPFSLFLFISGVVLCQFFVMPKAIEAMLWFNEWLGLEPDLRLNEWLGFALMMPLVFGISFQTPMVMMFAHKIGLVSVQMFRDKRRIAWFLMAVFAAVITPSVDAMSMLFLWVPMGALYELGILMCVYQGEPEEELAEWEKEEQARELVEV